MKFSAFVAEKTQRLKFPKVWLRHWRKKKGA